MCDFNVLSCFGKGCTPCSDAVPSDEEGGYGFVCLEVFSDFYGNLGNISMIGEDGHFGHSSLLPVLEIIGDHQRVVVVLLVEVLSQNAN